MRAGILAAALATLPAHRERHARFSTTTHCADKR